MTMMPTPDEIRPALAAWARKARPDRDTGNDLWRLLKRVLEAQTAVEPVLAPETYTRAGLPRRAASRAREHGAIITYLMDAIQVEFPFGAWIVQRTVPYKSTTTWGKLERHNGATPGCVPPPGDNIEQVLNNFADQAESRLA